MKMSIAFDKETTVSRLIVRWRTLATTCKAPSIRSYSGELYRAVSIGESSRRTYRIDHEIVSPYQPFFHLAISNLTDVITFLAFGVVTVVRRRHRSSRNG